MMLEAVLFDLDGTLADTAPDLAHALNITLEKQNRTPLAFETIRPHVSHGATALIKLGFPDIEPDSEQFETLRLLLLDVYRKNLSLHTRLFAGMDTLLAELEQRGMKWGVVTNKPGWLTKPLLDDLGLTARAACIVSGDTTELRKPHPQPVLHACEKIGKHAEQCIYIGDARRDIEAGRNAGMKTLIALFGYIGEQDTPGDWQADAMMHNPLDILDWILDFNSGMQTGT